jgi:hypothetical protein
MNTQYEIKNNQNFIAHINNKEIYLNPIKQLAVEKLVPKNSLLKCYIDKRILYLENIYKAKFTKCL